VTEKEVLEDNFGGEVMGQTGGMGIGMGIRPSSRMIRRYTNAYMLVYIRESELDNVLCPVKEEDIPEHLGKYKTFF
jgi:ubiquitin carboxyl-terminal hydrolase 7